MEFVLLLLGFGLLIKSADYVVDGASFMAEYLKIPALIIGFTVVAFCTSAPELAVSVTASLKSQNDLAFGTVIGSNIFNLLIVIGMAGFIKTLYMGKAAIYKEFPFLILSSILILILCSDMIFRPGSVNMLSKTDGVILIIFFGVFIHSLLKVTLKPRNKFMLDEVSLSIDVDSYITTQDGASKCISLNKALLLSFIGIIGLIIGSQIVVKSAITIANNFGVSSQLIGLTIIAIGTSLPEFIIAIIAASRGESDIALGNIIGSNTFNVLFILGVSSLASPMPISSELFLDILFMIIATIVTYIFALREKDINKFESITLICIYVLYVLFLLSSY